MYVATQSDGSQDVRNSISLAPLIKFPVDRLFLCDLQFLEWGAGVMWGTVWYVNYMVPLDHFG